MYWLNYHHLFYFWKVAQLGSVTAAAQELHLTQPTLSAQLKRLEVDLGEKLFEKNGRLSKLTEPGQLAARYCEQIFSLGTELFELLEGKAAGRADVLRVGISDVLPKTLVYRIIEPVYALRKPPKLVLVEDHTEKLLSELAVNFVDIVLSDCPIPPSIRVRAYNHLLGESGVSFMAAPALQRRYAENFPLSLEQAPLLWPSSSAALRGELDQWFERRGVRLNIAAEFQDSALMKAFGRKGRGVFPVPSAIEKEVAFETKTKVVGRIAEKLERFYLISTEKRLRHPGIAQLCQEAQQRLF